MIRYEEGLTLAAARERYFLENGFNPAYDDRWVKLKLGRRSLPLFPNTRARVAAARIHDLHHVAAEYETTWVGEGEIAAWELASSCGPYLAAWLLNLSAFGIGLCLAPRRIWRAFMRGRNSHNLYGEGVSAARLAQSLGEVRRELGLDRPMGAAAPAEIAFFCLWVLLALLYAFGGMLSFALFAIALWKLPASERDRPPAPTENAVAPAE